MREPNALGTAGGLYYFQDTILSPIRDDIDSEMKQVDAFFVMNGDVCADFPFNEMLKMHFDCKQNQPVLITVMATETTRQHSIQYGKLYTLFWLANFKLNYNIFGDIIFILLYYIF